MTPNVNYSGRTAPLTSKVAFYTFIQQIYVLNILNMVYTLCFFFSKCSLFHNSNVFGSCIIHILYTGCAKIKKNNSGTKSLMHRFLFYNKFIICLYTFRALLWSSSDGQNCILQHLSSTQVERGLSAPVHRTATYSVWRYQMLYSTILIYWWWTQQCSKHVEAYNKLIIQQEFAH